MLSADLNQAEAERIAQKVLRSIIEAEIKLHEDFINTSNSVINNRRKEIAETKWDFFNIKFERGINKGAIIALEGRINSHTEFVKKLKRDLEILELNLL